VVGTAGAVEGEVARFQHRLEHRGVNHVLVRTRRRPTGSRSGLRREAQEAKEADQSPSSRSPAPNTIGNASLHPERSLWERAKDREENLGHRPRRRQHSRPRIYPGPLT
jgi:hypothetical protein